MGEKIPNNRIPEYDEGARRFVWRHNRPGLGEAVVVSHEKNDESVQIDFLEQVIDLPRAQVRWLAEVLLQITDFYREAYISDARDDYNRPDVSPGDRR